MYCIVLYCKAKIVESMTLRNPKMLSHKVRPDKESQYCVVLYGSPGL